MVNEHKLEFLTRDADGKLKQLNLNDDDLEQNLLQDLI